MTQSSSFDQYGSDLLGESGGIDSDQRLLNRGYPSLFGESAQAAPSLPTQSAAFSPSFTQSHQQNLNDSAFQYSLYGVGGSSFVQQSQQQQCQQQQQSPQSVLFRGMLALLVCESQACTDWMNQIREMIEQQGGVCMSLSEFSSLESTPRITHVVVSSSVGSSSQVQQTLLHLRLALDDSPFFVMDKYIVDSIRQGFRLGEREYPPFSLTNPPAIGSSAAQSSSQQATPPGVSPSLFSNLQSFQSQLQNSAFGVTDSSSFSGAMQQPSSGLNNYVIPQFYLSQQQQYQQLIQPGVSALGLALNGWPTQETKADAASMISNPTFGQPLGQYIAITSQDPQFQQLAASVAVAAASTKDATVNGSWPLFVAALQQQSLQQQQQSVASVSSIETKEQQLSSSTDTQKQSSQKSKSAAVSRKAPAPKVAAVPVYPAMNFRDDLDVNLFVKASRDSKFIPQFPEIVCTLTWKHKYDIKIATNNPIFRDMDADTIKSNLVICLVLSANKRIPNTKMNISAMAASSPSVQAALQANNAMVAAAAAASTTAGRSTTEEEEEDNEEEEEDSQIKKRTKREKKSSSSKKGAAKKRSEDEDDGTEEEEAEAEMTATANAQLDLSSYGMHNYREENNRNPTITISNFHKISDREVVARFGVNTTFCSKRFNYNAFRICVQFCPQNLPPESCYFTIFSPEFKTFVKKNAGILKYLHSPVALNPQILLQTVRRGDVLKESEYSNVSEKFGATTSSAATPSPSDTPMLASESVQKTPAAAAAAVAAQGSRSQLMSPPASIPVDPAQHFSANSQPEAHSNMSEFFVNALAQMRAANVQPSAATLTTTTPDSPGGSKKRKRQTEESQQTRRPAVTIPILSIPALQSQPAVSSASSWLQSQQPPPPQSPAQTMDAFIRQMARSQQDMSSSSSSLNSSNSSNLEIFAMGPLVYRIGGFAYVRLPSFSEQRHCVKLEESESTNNDNTGPRMCICRITRAYHDSTGSLVVLCQRFYRKDEVEVPVGLEMPSLVLGRELIMSLDTMTIPQIDLLAPCQVKYVGDAQLQIMQYILSRAQQIPQEEEARNRLAEDWCSQGQDFFFFYKYVQRTSSGALAVSAITDKVKKMASSLLSSRFVDSLFPTADQAGNTAVALQQQQPNLGSSSTWSNHATLMQQLSQSSSSSANQQTATSGLLSPSVAGGGHSSSSSSSASYPQLISNMYNTAAGAMATQLTQDQQQHQILMQPGQLSFSQFLPQNGVDTASVLNFMAATQQPSSGSQTSSSSASAATSLHNFLMQQ